MANGHVRKDLPLYHFFIVRITSRLQPLRQHTNPLSEEMLVQHVSKVRYGYQGPPRHYPAERLKVLVSGVYHKTCSQTSDEFRQYGANEKGVHTALRENLLGSKHKTENSLETGTELCTELHESQETSREERSGVRFFVTSSFTQSDHQTFIVQCLMIALRET